MAQTGYTPIQLYYSATASSVPLAANLASGELAINTNDGKLYYKDSAGVVQTIASKAGNVNVSSFSAGTTGLTPNSATAGAVTLAGTLATTNGGTGLTSFTANGVVYASSTSALATGSALTFDGTYFTVGASSTTGDYKAFIQKVGGELLGLNASSGTLARIAFGNATASFGSTQIIANAADLAFITNSAEQMRLTSTGLGIGTSSPAAKLDVATTTGFTFDTTSTAGVKVGTQGTTGGSFMVQTQSASASYGSGLAVDGTYSSGTLQSTVNIKAFGVYSGGGYGSSLAFHTSSGTTLSQKMLLDSSGNLGLGVTPSVNSLSGSGYRFLEVGSAPGAGLYCGGFEAFLTCNSYYNGGWKYANNALATQYGQSAGAHQWFIAPSGTAGDPITFTQAMTLDASGNLGVGTTSPSGRLHVSTSGETTSRFDGSRGAADNLPVVTMPFWNVSNGVGDKQIATIGVLTGTSSNQTQKGQIYFSTSDGTLTERARIDSSGNLLVGTTSASSSITNGFTVTGPAAVTALGVGHVTGSGSGTNYVVFNYDGSAIGSITQSGTTAVLYNVTSDQRLKENIVDAPEFGSVIDSIKVRSYDWKADGNHQRAGFIAQELVTVAPEAVHQPADPEQMMAVDYSKLVPMLVKEIQSLRKRLADAGIA